MNSKIKNPLLTVRLVAILMSFIGIANLFCFFAPLALIICIYGSFTIANFCESLGLYVKEIGKALNIFSTHLVIYLLLLSFVMCCIYIISGIFIIFRKSWARRLIVYSLVIFIPLCVINSIVVSLVGPYSPNYRGILRILHLIFNICLLYLFTRVQIKRLFTERTAEQKINSNI